MLRSVELLGQFATFGIFCEPSTRRALSICSSLWPELPRMQPIVTHLRRKVLGLHSIVAISSPPMAMVCVSTRACAPYSVVAGIRGNVAVQSSGGVSLRSNSVFLGQGVKGLGLAAEVRRQGTKNVSVVSMAKREEQLVDIRKMSDEDINTTVVDLKGELFLLRTKQATRQEYKSSEFRRIRKQIARMLTVRRERELERGVSLRESRKLDREWKKNIVIRPPPSYAASLAEQEKR